MTVPFLVLVALPVVGLWLSCRGMSAITSGKGRPALGVVQLVAGILLVTLFLRLVMPVH